MDFRWNILDREYINYYKTKSIIIHTEIYVKQIYNMFNSLNYNTNQILLRIKFLLMALLVHENFNEIADCTAEHWTNWKIHTIRWHHFFSRVSSVNVPAPPLSPFFMRLTNFFSQDRFDFRNNKKKRYNINKKVIKKNCHI